MKIYSQRLLQCNVVVTIFFSFTVVGFISGELQERWGTSVTVTALRGTTARLPCSTHSTDGDDPVLLVLWYKNTSVTPVYSYDSRGKARGSRHDQQWGNEAVWGDDRQRTWFDMTSSPAHLVIKDVQGNDEAPYRCKVHFKSSPSWSQKINLIVMDPPGFPRIEDGVGSRMEGIVGPFENGNTIRIICKSSGEPPPKLEWTRIKKSQVTPMETKANFSQTTMTFVASRQSANARISCISVSRSAARERTESSITVQVNLAPLSVEIESPAAWVVGSQTTQFRCRVDGAYPKAKIEWRLGGRKISEGIKNEVIMNGNATLSILTFIPKPEDDKDSVVCRASSVNLPNTVLQDQISLRVHYVPLASIQVGEEQEVTEGSSIDAKLGSRIQFTCKIDANPPPYNVTWFHNGKLIVTSSVVQIDQRRMIIRNISSENSGLYTCVSSNDEGDGQSNAVNVNVFYSPLCQPGQPREYIVERGGSVSISCEVSAFPESVTFSWARRQQNDDVEQLPNVGRLKGLVGRYMLTDIQEDNTEVLCLAKNSVGVQKEPCVFHILTQGRPSSVSNCNVTNHTTSGFVVRCRQKQSFHGKFKLSYNLLVYAQSLTTSYSENQKLSNQTATSSFGALDVLHRNLSSQNPLFKVNGLESGKEFAVVIRASNKDGVSPPAVLSAFTLRDTAQTLKGMPSSKVNREPSFDGSYIGDFEQGKTHAGAIEDDFEDTESFFFNDFVHVFVIIISSSILVLGTIVTAAIYMVRRKRRSPRKQQKTSENEDQTYSQSELLPEVVDTQIIRKSGNSELDFNSDPSQQGGYVRDRSSPYGIICDNIIVEARENKLPPKLSQKTTKTVTFSQGCLDDRRPCSSEGESPQPISFCHLTVNQLPLLGVQKLTSADPQRHSYIRAQCHTQSPPQLSTFSPMFAHNDRGASPSTQPHFNPNVTGQHSDVSTSNVHSNVERKQCQESSSEL